MTGADAARPQRNIVRGGPAARIGLRSVALGYLAVLLIIPVIVIIAKAFEDGAGNVFDTLTTPEAQHAFWLTLVMVAVAIPLNTIFGVACALVLVRHNFRGKGLINALIDLPFAISPVVIGLALVLVYGSLDGWFGVWLLEQGIRVIFTPVGMALATMFVSLPFVVREVEPVLREIGEIAREAGARVLVDEVYLDAVYEDTPRTAFLLGP
jgi:sulfate transport system permease protein